MAYSCYVSRMEKLDFKISSKKSFILGGGRGAVGKAVVSNIRELKFESSHQQNLNLLSTVLKKTKIKKKRPGMAQFF